MYCVDDVLVCIGLVLSRRILWNVEVPTFKGVLVNMKGKGVPHSHFPQPRHYYSGCWIVPIPRRIGCKQCLSFNLPPCAKLGFSVGELIYYPTARFQLSFQPHLISHNQNHLIIDSHFNKELGLVVIGDLVQTHNSGETKRVVFSEDSKR